MKYLGFCFSLSFLTACAVGPNYRRPAVQIPENFRSPEPLPAPTARIPCRPEMVRGFQRRKVAGPDPHRARSRTTICATPSRMSRPRAPTSASPGRISIRISRPAAIWSSPGFRATDRFRLPATFVPSQNRNWGQASLNLLSFEARYLGPAAARHRSRARQPPERRGKSQSRDDDSGRRCRDGLLHSSRARLRTGDLAANTRARGRNRCGLIQSRQGGGVATLLDLRQGEQLVYTASETIPALQQQIEQTENQISLLLARNPGAIVRGNEPAPNRSCRRKCPPASLPRCSNGVPTSARPNRA